MATKIRRSFTDEFKQEAVSLLASSGRPLTQVARELGIQPSMLPDCAFRWIVNTASPVDREHPIQLIVNAESGGS